MSTAIDYHPSQPNIRSRHHYTRLEPQNTNTNNIIELTDFTNSPPPPPYTEQADSNSPTPEAHPPPSLSLQIETPGKPIISLPLPPHSDPIPIYQVDTTTPKFISFRPSRASGSSYLVLGDSPNTILSTTTYRFGPGKPPRVRLLNPYSGSNPRPGEGEDDSSSTFEILSSGLFTRAVRFQLPGVLSTSNSSSNSNDVLTWRYASKKEQKALGDEISSLLILSKTSVRNGKETGAIPVARFIRSVEFRTKGSTASSAGNGGRLEILDLDKAGWGEDDKVKREMVLVMVVTTVLVMLKREVDRRRAQQIAVLAGAGSG